MFRRSITVCIVAAAALVSRSVLAETWSISHPYRGITLIHRVVPTARGGNPGAGQVSVHIARINLAAPDLSLAITERSGTRETRRETTVDYLHRTGAQLAINVAFFNPVVPAQQVAASPDVFLAGLIVSHGKFVSDFDNQPADPLGTDQSYAIVPFAPALNIDTSNHASIVHRLPPDNRRVVEKVTLWNTLSGSAQIITDGRITIPTYVDVTNTSGLLTANSRYSNANSWYYTSTSRTVAGITRDGRTLVLLVADLSTGGGMSVEEAAILLQRDYDCWQALNLDGGGSSSMALRDPDTGKVSLLHPSPDASAPAGRAVGANLAVFAAPMPRFVTDDFLPVLGLLAFASLIVAGSSGRRHD